MNAESKIKKALSEADTLLGVLDRYVTLVQNAPYTRRMQVALGWSAASLCYLGFGLEVASSSSATLSGLSINGMDHEKFCGFLLIMTSYYTLMFSFVFAKVWSVSRPERLFRRLFRYAKKQIKKHGIEFREGAEGAADMFLGVWETSPHIPPESFDKSDISAVRSLKSEGEVRDFMVRRPLLGLLENLFARMLFPALVCALALGFLVAEIFFNPWASFG